MSRNASFAADVVGAGLPAISHQATHQRPSRLKPLPQKQHPLGVIADLIRNLLWMPTREMAGLARNDATTRRFFKRQPLPQKRVHVCLLALLIFVTFTPTTLAQSTDGDYRLVRHVTAAGGGESNGGGYTLRATIGQAEAATPAMQGGGFTLHTGYWTGTTGDDPGTPGDDPIFSDGFENTGGTP